MEEVKEKVNGKQSIKKEEKKHKKSKLVKKIIHNEDDIKKIKELEEALLKARADNINYRKRKDETLELELIVL